MANFGQLILTNSGIQAQILAQNGGKLKFTRIGMGSGNYSGNIASLSRLVSEKVSVTISSGYAKDTSYTIEGFFSNEELQTGFEWREIGVFATIDDGSEVLYCYANAGNTYDFIPATGDERYTKYIRVAMAVGNASNVSIVENEGLVYVDTFTFNTAIEDLQTEVNELYPSKEANGRDVAVADSANLPLLGMSIFGKSTQNKTTGKNLFQITATTKTMHGVTFTINEDGSVTANGTATESIYFELGIFSLEEGSYILSGCNKGSKSTYLLYFQKTDGSGGGYLDRKSVV